MLFARLSSLLREISRFGSRNSLHSYSYRKGPPDSSIIELYRRISPVGDPKVSIVPILDRWVEEGRSVDRKSLIYIIKELRSYKRYPHALEVSRWMSDRRYFKLTPSQVAIRLDLISKTQGIEQAEIYFDNLSQNLKGVPVYGALLKCYVNVGCVEKAEAIMQKMRDSGFAMQALDYNIMLTQYYKAGNVEKFDALLKEMEERGIVRDNITLCLQLSTYAALKDIEGIDKIVMMMESDPEFVPDWTNYNAAASAYIKVGLFDKALEMLMKAEPLISRNGRYVEVYNKLLTQYAKIGRKDEVLKLWSLYKNGKVYNKGYMRVLNSLVKLGDLEMAEEIFYEWESQDLSYDMRIPSIMIGAYSRNGLIGKAEALLDKAISKGGKPNAWTWYFLVEGYLKNQQPQKAVEMMEKTIALLSGTGQEPVPEVANLKACLEYLKGLGDRKQTEEFVNLLVDKGFISSANLEELSIDKDERSGHN